MRQATDGRTVARLTQPSPHPLHLTSKTCVGCGVNLCRGPKTRSWYCAKAVMPGRGKGRGALTQASEGQGSTAAAEGTPDRRARATGDEPIVRLQVEMFFMK